MSQQLRGVRLSVCWRPPPRVPVWPQPGSQHGRCAMKPRSAGYFHVGARKAMSYPQALPVVSACASAQVQPSSRLAGLLPRGSRAPVSVLRVSRVRRWPTVLRSRLPSLAALTLAFSFRRTSLCRARPVSGRTRRVASADFWLPKVRPGVCSSSLLLVPPAGHGAGALRGPWPHHRVASGSFPNRVRAGF